MAISHVDKLTRYSELDTRSADIDRVVADVTDSVLDRIEVLSRP